MRTNLIQTAKAFIASLNQKLSEFLDSALGPKVKASPPRSPDPMILLSRRAIKKEIYKRTR